MATTTTNKSRKNDLRGNTTDRANRRVGAVRHWGKGCIYCGLVLKDCGDVTGHREEDTLTIDRIIPGAKSGTYRMKNVAPACFTCNDKKGDKDLVDFVGPEKAARITAIAASYKRAPRK